MQVKAKVKFIRMSPRKVRLVADLVRGKKIDEAVDQLSHINKWAKTPVRKLIESAVANAEHNFDLEKNNLYISEIKVDEGTTLKRWMPRAYGRATPIRKRMSHIVLTLSEIKDSGEKKGKKPKAEAPIKMGQQEKEKAEKSPKEGRKEEKKEPIPVKDTKEKGKDIHDPRNEGGGKHTKIEGKSHKGVSGKIFRRKSG